MAEKTTNPTIKNALKIILTCPMCGNSTFAPADDGAYKCLSCGDVSFPEQMAAAAKPVNQKNN